jgi:uncharacterized repeat protein (TIGR03803 family)
MINLNYSRFLVSRPRAGVFLALSDPALGRVPGLALLMRLFWAAALVLTTLGAQARVVFTSLYSFTCTKDGANPRAALVQGSDGYYYGTTFGGGTSGFGTVFKISPNGTLTSLYSFGSIVDGGKPVDGVYPSAALVRGSDGYFYGTTYGFGYGCNTGNCDTNPGTVFRISSNGTLTTLYSFTGGNDGGFPGAGLVQGSDGNFYGTTQYDGRSNAGTVFRLTISPDPQLTLFSSGTYVILTWPTNSTGYNLQSATNLASPVWTTNSAPHVILIGQNTVTNPISGTQQFFQLSH